MTITCPKNPAHDRFRVQVRVSEGWVVDEDGDFIELTGEPSETIRRPGTDDDYECEACAKAGAADCWANVA